MINYGLRAIESTVDEEEDFNATNLEIAVLTSQGYQYFNKDQKQECLDGLSSVRNLLMSGSNLE